MLFKVIQPGLETTLQDSGRMGQRDRGIAQSGAADRLSFAIANHSVGNKWDYSALEVAIGGLVLEAQQDTEIALSGANITVTSGDKRFTQNRAHMIKSGDIISFGYASFGARIYLAVRGGFDGQLYEGSRSTYTPAALGGIGGRPLEVKDELKGLNEPSESYTPIPKDLCPVIGRGIMLRVQKGPEFDSHLSASTRRRLFTEYFTCGPLSNRMGAHLTLARSEQNPLDLSDKTPLTSSPLLPASLQITSDGTPILSGIDSHCTGGYARALTVIPADHWQVGQIAPGTRIYFRRVSSEAAEEALNIRQKVYAAFIPDFHFD